jgi:hypothetical protein
MTSPAEERAKLTFLTVAAIERTSVAKLRRAILEDWVTRALSDPDVAEIVRLMTAARNRRAKQRTNVLPMRRR